MPRKTDSLGSLEISDSSVSQTFLTKLNDRLRRVGSFVTTTNGASTSSSSQSSAEIGQLILSSPGTQAIQSNVAPVLSLGTATQFSTLLAYLKQAPVGGALTAQLYVSGSSYGPLISLTGTSFTASLSGVGSIAANAIIRLDVVGVPSTFPGSDLSVILR